MTTQEVKQLLQRYFDGESTLTEERMLETYFRSGKVAKDLREYTGFFSGLAELSESINEDNIEQEILEFIQEKEVKEKQGRHWLWQTVTGIAASVILVVGGMLLYQQQEQSQQFKDTFDNPEIAYAYFEQTMGYMSSKYNKGLNAISGFDKLQAAARPLQKGMEPVNQYMEIVQAMSRWEPESEND
jgi:hypothetical protein